MAMQTFKNILVPTDFGEPAGQALEIAVELAQRFEAKLTLLHVHSIPNTYGYGEGLLWPVEELARSARKTLDDTVAQVKERYARVDAVLETTRAIDAVLATGNASERILAAAEDCAADLIVMGTHGRRGLSHVLLGSVAEKVVRRSPVPVLTVGSRGEAQK
jgi:nucleotide-binding universal stress UspA family protein